MRTICGKIVHTARHRNSLILVKTAPMARHYTRNTKLKPSAELPFGTAKGGKFALKVFKRMFAVVGRTFAPKFLHTPDWFKRSSWTLEQSNEFRDWMVREGMKTMRWRKRQATWEAGMFLLFYGWTIKPVDL